MGTTVSPFNFCTDAFRPTFLRVDIPSFKNPKASSCATPSYAVPPGKFGFPFNFPACCFLLFDDIVINVRNILSLLLIFRKVSYKFLYITPPLVPVDSVFKLRLFYIGLPGSNLRNHQRLIQPVGKLVEHAVQYM